MIKLFPYLFPRTNYPVLSIKNTRKNYNNISIACHYLNRIFHPSRVQIFTQSASESEDAKVNWTNLREIESQMHFRKFCDIAVSLDTDEHQYRLVQPEGLFS